MQTGIIIAIVFLALAIFFVLALLIVGPGSLFGGNDETKLKSMVHSQRTESVRATREENFGVDGVLRSAKQHQTVKRSSKLTIDKRLKYGQFKMAPTLFHALEIFIGVVCMALASFKFNMVLTLAAFFLGPVVMRWVLNFKVESRYKRFDKDYPAFLLSLVGLLKTGMNTMTAIDNAAMGLEEDSLLRQEVEMMSERLKLGVPEDKSIGAFGEDIYHPEIELFVQAILLSRQVGGNLSDTLDRLAKQVRKRQYFRSSARAAVGMQRGSIAIILCIMFALLGYLAMVYPEAVFGAIEDPIGWQVYQIAILMILFGIFWIRQVTKLKI